MERQRVGSSGDTSMNNLSTKRTASFAAAAASSSMDTSKKERQAYSVLEEIKGEERQEEEDQDQDEDEDRDRDDMYDVFCNVGSPFMSKRRLSIDTASKKRKNNKSILLDNLYEDNVESLVEDIETNKVSFSNPENIIIDNSNNHKLYQHHQRERENENEREREVERETNKFSFVFSDTK